LSRTLAAVRLDLLVAVSLTAIALLIGVPLGALAGFFGGIQDSVIMRLADVALAFPFLVLVIGIAALLGPGLSGVYLVVILISWALFARLTRAEMLVVKQREFILAARTLGFSNRRILVRHALTNVWRAPLVYSAADIVLNIAFLATLSFLGLGVQPPTPELGAIIADGQGHLLTAWWITTLPGLLLVVLGVGLSLVGDATAELLGGDIRTGDAVAVLFGRNIRFAD
jgi:peptide/nickel transport system permease protein